MRVLIVVFPAPSHYFPLVPIGWALRASGHEVRVACPASFTGVVTASGLPAVLVPEVDLAAFWRRGQSGPPPVRPSAESAAEARAARAMAMFTQVAAQTAPRLTEFVRYWRADLVICEPRGYGGMVAADAVGVPVVRHLYGVDYTYQRSEQEHDALRPLAAAFPSWRADPLGDLTVDPCPPSMQVPGPLARLRVRYVPYNGPGVLPAWLSRPKRRPRVCVTWGTTHSRDAEGLAQAKAAIHALAGLDADIVAALPTGSADRLGPVGAGTTVAEALPLHLLLPTCDAIVHQGGAGTTMTSVACCTPQLVLPDVADRMLNAAQVAAAGAGLVRRHADSDAIGGAVRDLLTDPGYREAASSLRAEGAAQPPPADAVDPLTELAAATGAALPGRV